MEDMPADEYLALSYYERWVNGTEALLIEKGILTEEEIDRKMAELEEHLGRLVSDASAVRSSRATACA